MRPESFDSYFLSDWSHWVLDHGLVELPDALRPGEAVPIARWIGPRFAAVLHVGRTEPDEDDDTYEDEYDTEVETFARSAYGWEDANGSGGGGWPAPPFERVVVDPREASIWHLSCASGDDWSCCAVYGVAGEEATTVELHDADGITRHPLNSPLGVFLVCSDGNATAEVRVVDAGGVPLLSEEFGGEARLSPGYMTRALGELWRESPDQRTRLEFKPDED